MSTQSGTQRSSATASEGNAYYPITQILARLKPELETLTLRYETVREQAAETVVPVTVQVQEFVAEVEKGIMIEEQQMRQA